jgi:hypothetical protein
MLRALGSEILQAISNEANAGCLDVSNQLIDFRLRLRIQPNAIEALSSSMKIEAKSWRMRLTGGFGGKLRADPRSAASSIRGP